MNVLTKLIKNNIHRFDIINNEAGAGGEFMANSCLHSP